MDDPAHPDQPEQTCEAKLDQRDERPALQQLAKTGDKKTGESRDDVSGGSLSCHNEMREFFQYRRQVKLFLARGGDVVR